MMMILMTIEMMTETIETSERIDAGGGGDDDDDECGDGGGDDGDDNDNHNDGTDVGINEFGGNRGRCQKIASTMSCVDVT